MQMTSKTAAIAFVVGAALTAAAPAFAATAGAPAAAFGGPAVSGVCLLGQEAVFSNAKVGVAATARLRQLAAAAQSELTPERKALEDEAKALDARKASLKPAELQQRQQVLAQRAQAYQAKATQRSQQIEATRAKALRQISEDEQSVVADVYKARGCGVMFSRDAVLAGGTGMDLTPAVVQGLDAKVTTMTFDLEPPATPTGQAAAR
jgi:Skp family chaperone for outer membrane proteins